MPDLCVYIYIRNSETSEQSYILSECSTADITRLTENDHFILENYVAYIELTHFNCQENY